MADFEEKISRAWEMLAPALGSDLRIIQSEVKAGKAQLIEWGNGELYTVTRAEVAADGPELVIVAAAGRHCVKYTEEIHELARKQGFKTVRLHTKRPDAMLRMGRGLGYQRAETILRAVL
ncbi:hypothetical protein [Shewanella algae]